MSANHLAARPRVVIITTHWGESDDETTLATRLVAGALALEAEIDVIHLVDELNGDHTITDSVFTVHRVLRHGARILRSNILRAALAGGENFGRIPEAASSLLGEYEGDAPEVIPLVHALNPDTVVLAGHRQSYDVTALKEAASHPRVVVLPFTADPATLCVDYVRQMLQLADVIAIAHEGERIAIADAVGITDETRIVPLDVAFPINRSGTAQGLFGVRFFGRYVVLIRDFPPNGPRFERSVTHEVLRKVLGTVSVAEVDGDKWRISDRENTLEFPVNPSRVNLWRLMAHAIITVDARPPGPIGREAIESMMLGTPVVVPDNSAAMHHAKAANGGLWYRDIGEMFDASRALMGARLRARLGAQGRTYTELHHGQMDDFAKRMTYLALPAHERIR